MPLSEIPGKVLELDEDLMWLPCGRLVSGVVVVVLVDSVHGRNEGVPQLTGVSVVDCCQGQSGR